MNNIVILVLDAFPPNYMTKYGGGITLPNLDKWSSENITFNNFISAGTFTPPALTSIATGLDVISHPIRVVPDRDTRLPSSITTIFDHLHKFGYSTSIIADSYHIPAEVSTPDTTINLCDIIPQHICYDEDIVEVPSRIWNHIKMLPQPYVSFIFISPNHAPFGMNQDEYDSTHGLAFRESTNDIDARVVAVDGVQRLMYRRMREVDEQIIKPMTSLPIDNLVIMSDHGLLLNYMHGGAGFVDVNNMSALCCISHTESLVVDRYTTSCDIFPILCELGGLDIPDGLTGLPLSKITDDRFIHVWGDGAQVIFRGEEFVIINDPRLHSDWIDKRYIGWDFNDVPVYYYPETLRTIDPRKSSIDGETTSRSICKADDELVSPFIDWYESRLLEDRLEGVPHLHESSRNPRSALVDTGNDWSKP